MQIMLADGIFEELTRQWLPEVVLLGQMLNIPKVVTVDGRQACHQHPILGLVR